MLVWMDWQLLQEDAITTPEQLKALLLARFPEADREMFLDPVHPSELTSEQTGVSLSALAQAKTILEEAIAQKKSVVIFGDYDCDGVTATAVLWEALRSRGLMARPFLPHREKHGYGLSITALQDVFAEGKPDLIITVDNGIVANEAFAWLKEQGVASILTDHHIAHGELPPADAILHSTLLSGATVSWLLAHAIAPDVSADSLDLAILGMIADQVPLTGPGRSFAVYGMKALRNTRRPSLLELAEVANVKLELADTNTIHFALAPRINAMGRLRHALDSLRALLSRNPTRIHELMSELQSVNEERQKLTFDAIDGLKKKLDPNNKAGIEVVLGEYPEGIIGLLASKVVELTGRPALVGSTLGEVVKFSCRSVVGIDITAFLRSLSEISYLSLGGHAMAAGFSLAPETLESAVEIIKTQAGIQIAPNLRPPTISILAPLDFSSVTNGIMTVLEEFAPFGAQNTEPKFLLKDFSVEKIQPLGKEEKHHKLLLRQKETGNTISVVIFQTEKRTKKPLVELESFVVRLERSRFRPERKAIEVIVEWAK
jgi:single-stranded-DNA-specific exonuclease